MVTFNTWGADSEMLLGKRYIEMEKERERGREREGESERELQSNELCGMACIFPLSFCSFTLLIVVAVLIVVVADK